MTLRCKYRVWKRDTYRLHRGRGFKLDYKLVQCSRRPSIRTDYCWQHVRLIEQLGRREMLETALPESDPS